MFVNYVLNRHACEDVREIEINSMNCVDTICFVLFHLISNCVHCCREFC